MKSIENLVFQGGGVLGTAYVGAFQALQARKILGWENDSVIYKSIKRVAGTSAGSICSALVSMGHNAESIENVMKNMDFTKFADFGKLTEGGLCEGKEFLNWMKNQVKNKLGNPEATFTDLKKRFENDPKYKDLHVFAQHVETKRTVEFSAETTPDVSIAEAVRASMSIPFFYVPWQFKDQKNYPGSYIDGGVYYNYPISTFDGNGPLDNTLGFSLVNRAPRSDTLATVMIHFFIKDFLSGLINIDNIPDWMIDAFDDGILAMINKVISILFEDKSPGNDIKTVIKKLNVLENILNPKNLNNQLIPELSIIQSILNILFPSSDKSMSWIIKFIIIGVIAFLGLFFRNEIENFKTEITNWLKEIKGAVSEIIKPLDDFISKYLNVMVKFIDIFAATLNLPTNFVQKRDAPRTVYLNDLGYNAIDFWMPEGKKNNLIKSGYNCTQDILNFILYS